MEYYKILSLESLEGEVWKYIEGYEGKYLVSNFGRVKSLFNKDRYREKILKQAKNGRGYLFLCFSKYGVIKKILIHRLVAQAFIHNPSNLPQVNHKDEVKTNNCVDNLEWCDAKYNISYNEGFKRRAESRDYKILSEKLSKQVYQYSKDGTLVAIYPSTIECQRNGFHSGCVSSCCRGKLKTHKGYIWSYTPLN